MILDDGTAVYESHYILDWLETKYPDHPILPDDVDGKLFVKKVEVVCDGMCDALVIAFFEKMREKEKQSEPWKARYSTLAPRPYRYHALTLRADKCVK